MEASFFASDGLLTGGGVIFASAAVLSVVLVLLIRPRYTEDGPAPPTP